MDNTENLQNWVDKLAAINSNVTKNDIMQWAAQVPLIPLDQYKTIPLFLYGDATLDKAIVDIIQNPQITEPAVNEIYGIISKTYIMDNVEDNNQVLTPETVSELPKSNNRPGDWNAMINDAPPSKEHKEPGRVPQNTVQRQRIGDYITQDKYESAHRVAAQDNSQNAVYFNRKSRNFDRENSSVIDMLNNEPLLREHGFEANNYDESHVLISNGSLDYVVETEPYLHSGAFSIEDRMGNGHSFPNIQAFVTDLVMKEPPELQYYFSAPKNFADSDDKTPAEEEHLETIAEGTESIEQTEEQTANDYELTLAQLANIMSLFQNDLLYMHHHSAGDEFDTVHKITQDLYERAGEDVDKLAEMAIRVGEQIGNFSDAQSIVSSIYDTITEGDVDIDRMESELNRKGGIILGALRRCRKYSSDIMSDIDALISYWATEIEYKNEARSKNFAASQPLDKAATASQIAEIATAVVDDLTNQYVATMEELEARTNEYEASLGLKEQNQEIIDELQMKLTGNAATDEKINEACKEYEQKNAELDEKIAEGAQVISDLLAKQKEFTDVIGCETSSQYKKELADLMLPKEEIVVEEAPVSDNAPATEEAPVAKNFDSRDDRNHSNDEHDIKPKSRDDDEGYKEYKQFKSLLSGSSKETPEEKAYKKAQEDLIGLRPEFQHLALMKQATAGAQRRQLEEMFKEYDHQKEAEDADWHKQQEIQLRDKYMQDEVALEQARQDIAAQYQMQNLGRDTDYLIAKQRILDKEANAKMFRQAATNGMVDIIVAELPQDKLMSVYDRVIGNKLMKDNPMVDKMLWGGLGTILRNKESLGNIAKAAAGTFLSRTTALDRATNRVAERLIRAGFSYKDIEPVTSGRLFSRLPSECIDVDAMTREAMVHITGSVNKGRKMFSRARKNFSNENYELVELQGMPARYKYSMSNPRYNFTENCWKAGDNNDDRGIQE